MAPPRKWTDEERAASLGIYVNEGLGAASRATGIPRGTISTWVAETPGCRSNAIQNREQVAAALEAGDLKWQAHKVELVKKFAAMADTMLEMAADYVEAGNVRNVKDALTSAAISVDKAQLLSGGATGRIEHSDINGELAAEVERIVEERRSLALVPVQVEPRRTA